VSESSGPAEPVASDSAKGEKPARTPKQRTPEQLERRQAIIRYTVFVVGGAVLTVLLYFLLSAFIPRWWSQAIGRQAGGRISAGIVLGLMYGFIFTFLPLIVAAQARHRAFKWPAKVIILLVAAALTAPNLMTLGIAVGTSRAAQAGNRTMDVTAPGFRQATLWGVIIGAGTAIIVVTLMILWERRARELRLLRARVEVLEKELSPALPGSSQAATSALPKSAGSPES
jgi:hypothetical protein